MDNRRVEQLRWLLEASAYVLADDAVGTPLLTYTDTNFRLKVYETSPHGDSSLTG